MRAFEGWKQHLQRCDQQKNKIAHPRAQWMEDCPEAADSGDASKGPIQETQQGYDGHGNGVDGSDRDSSGGGIIDDEMEAQIGTIKGYLTEIQSLKEQLATAKSSAEGSGLASRLHAVSHGGNSVASSTVCDGGEQCIGPLCWLKH